MSPSATESRFDPRAVLGAFQRAEAVFVLIGGLARVIRGADELTYGVDICPSLTDANRARVQAALDELDAKLVPARRRRRTGKAGEVLEFSTVAGPVKVVATPDGVPRGYPALRGSATIEHLGGGLRPSVAATADLITMATAHGRPQGLALVPALQRILQLEASPAQIIAAPATHDMPGPTLAPPGAEL